MSRSGTWQSSTRRSSPTTRGCSTSATGTSSTGRSAAIRTQSPHSWSTAVRGRGAPSAPGGSSIRHATGSSCSTSAAAAAAPRTRAIRRPTCGTTPPATWSPMVRLGGRGPVRGDEGRLPPVHRPAAGGRDRPRPDLLALLLARGVAGGGRAAARCPPAGRDPGCPDPRPARHGQPPRHGLGTVPRLARRGVDRGGGGGPHGRPCHPRPRAPRPRPVRPAQPPGRSAGGLRRRKYVQLVSFGSVNFSGAWANSGWRAATYARVRSGTSA